LNPAAPVCSIATPVPSSSRPMPPPRAPVVRSWSCPELASPKTAPCSARLRLGSCRRGPCHARPADARAELNTTHATDKRPAPRACPHRLRPDSRHQVPRRAHPAKQQRSCSRSAAASSTASPCRSNRSTVRSWRTCCCRCTRPGDYTPTPPLTPVRVLQSTPTTDSTLTHATKSRIIHQLQL
jgi:hypothetical protein